MANESNNSREGVFYSPELDRFEVKVINRNGDLRLIGRYKTAPSAFAAFDCAMDDKL